MVAGGLAGAYGAPTAAVVGAAIIVAAVLVIGALFRTVRSLE
jgi:hypothetical protein